MLSQGRNPSMADYFFCKLLSPTIAIVVDPAFGSRVDTLPADWPLWVAKTPINTPVVQVLRKTRPESSITEFTGDLKQEPTIWCVSVLQTVDLHHGPYSSDPPYRSLRVYGTPLTDDLREVLTQFGQWKFIESFIDGFGAVQLDKDCT